MAFEIKDKTNCNCIEIADIELLKHNGQVSVDLFSGRIVIQTIKRFSKRGKNPPHIIANFCPMCGKAYSK